MMTYYLKPPRGNMALHKLHKCVKERFQFLASLENGEITIPKNFEYLIDGTPLDRAGHFMLRLLSLSSYNFKMFVLKTETNLFAKRLDMLKYNEIINMLKTLYKHVLEIIPLLSDKNFIDFLSEVKHICKSMINMEAAVHVFKETHPETCSDYYISVPFKMCLPFVQKREVELKLGKCIVPCGKWKDLLKIIFHIHLEFGMKQLQITGCVTQAFSDSRIHQLAQELQKRFVNDTAQVGVSGMSAREVHSNSVYFPPCMAHLYQTLRSRHRLTHEARRQFTLFLKDAGMPVEEALTFWGTEYSRPSSTCETGCTHSWQKDYRRYRYSIRHMYGLEGGRYSYRVSSCRKIQEWQLTAQAEGGCPFQHFDNPRMISLVSSQLLSDTSTLNEILHLKATGKAHEACHLFLSAQENIICRTSNVDTTQNKEMCKPLSFNRFANPVQYYISLKSRKCEDSMAESN
ncbi:DNA primase large subunit-like [Periplaneta americana]|uniref:DNA primase large subunit-like n=1 Tax=Periplaneta americana TaxID=6978 RepID=UPI0037E9588D